MIGHEFKEGSFAASHRPPADIVFCVVLVNRRPGHLLGLLFQANAKMIQNGFLSPDSQAEALASWADGRPPRRESQRFAERSNEMPGECVPCRCIP